MPKSNETVTCPQCAGRGWKFPGFIERPRRILKFIGFVFSTIWEESCKFSACRACDKRGVVPKEWIDGED